MKRFLFLILAIVLALAIIQSIFEHSQEIPGHRYSPIEAFGADAFEGRVQGKYRDSANHLRAKLVLFDTVNGFERTVDITECLKLYALSQVGDYVAKQTEDYRVHLSKLDSDTIVLNVNCLD